MYLYNFLESKFGVWKNPKNNEIEMRYSILLKLCFFALFSIFICNGQPSDREIVKKLEVPSQLKEKLDIFFKKNRLTGDISLIREAINKGKLLKEIGSGTRVSVVEIPNFKNIVLKISIWDRPVSKSAKDPRLWFKSCIERENITRALRADHIRKIIKQYKLQNIKAPKKYLYHIPGTPDALTDSNYIVVAEKLMYNPKKNPYKESTKKQVFGLSTIMFHTYHTDNADGNIVLDDEGNLLIIDTDDSWIFLLKDDFLNIHQLRILAQFCAKRLTYISEVLPDFKEVISSFPLKKVLESITTCKPDSLRKIIMFYRDVSVIGAIQTDVTTVFSLSKKDQNEIVHFMNKKWFEQISKKYYLKQESKKAFKKILSI